jgi:hypothetical protein
MRTAYDEAAEGKNNMFFGKFVSNLRHEYEAEILDEKGKLVKKKMSKITSITTDQKVIEILQYAK